MASNSSPSAARSAEASAVPKSLAVVVTGATGGIGAEVSAELCRAGHHVLIAARNTDAAETLRSQLVTGHPDAQVSVAHLDLGSLESARESARGIRDAMPVIDVLVHNAGIFLSKPSRSPDGFESHLAVMHMAHWQLTRDLDASLRASDDPRIVSVSAWGHRFGRLDPDRLVDDQPTGFAAYVRAKLAQVLYVSELTRQRPDLTAMAVHPGVVRTTLGDSGMPGPIRRVLDRYASPADRAGAGLAELVTQPSLDRGGYYSYRTPRRRMPTRTSTPGRRARNEELAARLYDATNSALLK